MRIEIAKFRKVIFLKYIENNMLNKKVVKIK